MTYFLSVMLRLGGLIGMVYAAVSAAAAGNHVLALIIVVASLAIFLGVGLATHEPTPTRRRR